MIEDSNPFLGIYDMTVEVSEDAPKSLRYKLNQNICNGGGGGGQTQTSGIPEEFKPQVKEGLDINLARLRETQSDPTKMVAALNAPQQRALAYQQQLGEQAVRGTGIYDTRSAEERALKNLMGSSLGSASSGGALGSARSQAAMQGALADRAGKYQSDRQAMAGMGVEQIGQAGTTYQQQAQKEKEAKDTSLANFFANLAGAGTETKTTGGGK